MENYLYLLAAFGLVLLNGFFVAAEFAIVKLRQTQADALALKHGIRGRILKNVRSNLDAYLSACQLGITIASLGLGWIGEPAFARLLEEPLAEMGIDSPSAVHGISFAVAFSIISFLHIVVGELAPKSMAIRLTEPTSLWTGVPLWLFYWVMYPFIWLLNGSALILLKLIGIDPTAEGEDAHSVAELRKVLAASHVHGELGGEEVGILTRALDFSDLVVGELMRPAGDMVYLDLQKSEEENMAIIDRHQFSRYPVVDGDRDNVVGLAHVKDIYRLLRAGRPFSDVRDELRDVQLIHRETPAPELLAMFRGGHPHFAIVDDDLGQVVGFVTLDHLFEALVGQIQDEFQHRKLAWRELSDGSYLGSGALPLFSLERLLDIEIDNDDVDSVGGLVMWQLDRVPRKGDRATFEDFDIVVREMQGPRIGRVQVYPKRMVEDDEDEREARKAESG